ncbi:AAA family ATPase [Yanghanlia caeni]|uniref:AAA family ATPase n=1 Tax=Yanghanlia caeni TaxID=3064283 RepID=A0ABU1D9Y0_9BURK|nr:AAA family ATPase [Alcaligenaceae bacterium LG-2]
MATTAKAQKANKEAFTLPTASEATLLPPDRRVDLSEIDQMCETIDLVIADLRKRAIRPNPEKNPPRFTSSQVAELCGITRATLNYLVRKGELPQGEVHGSGASRTFSLAETQEWIRAMPEFSPKPEGVSGAVLATTMLKGGATKTTSTMSIAQGLTLLGRKVLVIDLDPQASLTELCGVFIQAAVDENDTVLNYIQDPSTTLQELVMPTYWANLDIIPSHAGLFAAEFQIPGMLMQDSSFRFFDLLRQGVEPLREHYDYIIFDTAPSLSYLNINALMAADSLVMPVVPESLDTLSSLVFWTLLRDFASPIKRHYGFNKIYDFVSILPTKVDNQKGGTEIVRHWIQRAYGHWVSPYEIPYSAAMSNSSVVISTVFDMNKNEIATKTLNRVREPLFNYVKWIDSVYLSKWTGKASADQGVAL